MAESLTWFPGAFFRPVAWIDESTSLGVGNVASAISSGGKYAVFSGSSCPFISATETLMIVSDGSISFTDPDGVLLSQDGRFIDGMPVFRNASKTKVLRYSAANMAWFYYDGEPEVLPRARMKFGDSSTWVGDGWYSGVLPTLSKGGVFLNDGRPESNDITLTGKLPRWEKESDSGEGIAGVYKPVDGSAGTLTIGSEYFLSSDTKKSRWRIINGSLKRDHYSTFYTSPAIVNGTKGHQLHGFSAVEDGAIFWADTLPTKDSGAEFYEYLFNAETGSYERCSDDPIIFEYKGLDTGIGGATATLYATETVMMQ